MTDFVPYCEIEWDSAPNVTSSMTEPACYELQ